MKTIENNDDCELNDADTYIQSVIDDMSNESAAKATSEYFYILVGQAYEDAKAFKSSVSSLFLTLTTTGLMSRFEAYLAVRDTIQTFLAEYIKRMKAIH